MAVCQQKQDCYSEYDYTTMPTDSTGADAVTKCDGIKCICAAEFTNANLFICSERPDTDPPLVNLRVDAVWRLNDEFQECLAKYNDDTFQPAEEVAFEQWWIAKFSTTAASASLISGHATTFLCSPYRAIKSTYIKVPALKSLETQISSFKTDFKARTVAGDFAGEPEVTLTFGTPYCPVFSPATRADKFGGTCQITECESGYEYKRDSFRLEIEPTCVSTAVTEEPAPEPAEQAPARTPDGSIDDQFIKAGIVLFCIIAVGLFFQLFGFCRSMGGMSKYKATKKRIEAEFDETTEPAEE